MMNRVKSIRPIGLDASNAMTSGDNPQSPRTKESQSSPDFITPQLEKELLKKFKNTNYFDLVADMKLAIGTKKHTFRFKTYDNCFPGPDALKWLIQSSHAANTMEAFFLCNEMVNHGHIYDAVDDDEQEFKIGHRLYRFSADDKKQINVDEIDLDAVEQSLSALVKRTEIVISGMTFADVFRGNDAIDLVLQKGFVTTTAEACQLCDNMVKAGILTVVSSTAGGEFKEGVYKIVDKKSRVPKAAISKNMVQLNSAMSKDALLVSKDGGALEARTFTSPKSKKLLQTDSGTNLKEWVESIDLEDVEHSLDDDEAGSVKRNVSDNEDDEEAAQPKSFAAVKSLRKISALTQRIISPREMAIKNQKSMHSRDMSNAGRDAVTSPKATGLSKTPGSPSTPHKTVTIQVKASAE